MEKMKTLTLLLGVLLLPTSALADRVFPENLLKKWGYKTAKVEKKHHAIRSLKNYGDSREAFYARFWICKSSFGSSEEASQKKEELDIARKETEAGFKDYTEIIQDGVDLYFISATSNYTRLSHQPKLMKLVEKHLKTKIHNKSE